MSLTGRPVCTVIRPGVLLGVLSVVAVTGRPAAPEPMGPVNAETIRPSLHAAGVRPAVRPGDLSLFVSPTGRDRNPGTRAAPLRSLQDARDVVRRLDRHMSGDITVYLEGGTYRLTRPLQMDNRDSGTGGHTVVWRAAPAQNVVISGAERVTGWTLHDRARGIWEAKVSRDLRTRQLYVNGMRAVLAAGPAPVSLTRIPTGYLAGSRTMAGWRNPNAIDFVYSGQLGLMAEPRCPVESIHGQVITMAQPCWDNSTMRQQNLIGFGTLIVPTYIENAYELLDDPGEFYLDNSAHTLFYIPRKGEDLRTADVEAPRLQALIQGAGSGAKPIQHLAFARLQFSYATWLQPGTREGFSDVQANYTLTGQGAYARQGLCHLVPHGTCPYGAWTREPGAVQLRNDRSISFSDDRFMHLGGAGLDLDNGSQEVSISASVFTDISGNGLEIGNVNRPDSRDADQTRAVTVRDNHLFGLPMEYHGGVAILVGYAAHCTIIHNQLDHLAHTAISMGWGGWLDKIAQPAVRNFSRDNVVADNRIYDFMQVLTDGGGIYTQGITGPSISHGEKVVGNVVHDQLAWGRALLSDDGATFVTYAANVLYNDTYDYCCASHANYRQFGSPRRRQFFAQVVRGNYWQQGDPDFSRSGVTESGNTLITGPEQAPASIVARAGIEPLYRSAAVWRSPGGLVPDRVGQVEVLYALRGAAYVTWHPGLAPGSKPIASYTVTACRIAGAPPGAGCGPNVTLPATEFERLGYAVVRGLVDGAPYTFTVTARSASGSSTPSIPSGVVIPTALQPGLPGPPTKLEVRAGRGRVAFSWYAPPSARTQPVVAYVLTGPGNHRYTVAGLRQLIVSNTEGKALRVMDALRARRRYRFTVAAVTPAGVGPAATFPPVIPGM